MTLRGRPIDKRDCVLESGRRRDTLAFDGPARGAARLIVSGLEGAMLVSRPYGDFARFQAAADRLMAGFAGGLAGHAAK
jgi:hypothetical protein